MEKKVLSSLELYGVIRELNFLKGALVNKIYQISPKKLLIRLYKSKSGRETLKIDAGHGMYLTKYNLKKPPYPPSFCMFLRKHLHRAKITRIVQKNLERIVEIHFTKNNKELILILELFSKGNFILTNSDYKIINVANVQKWKARTVKKGEIYKYPPKSAVDLFRLDYRKFARMFDSEKEIVRFLAAELGLGGLYAEEVCSKVDIDKNKQVNKVKESEARKIFRKLKELVAKFENMNLDPAVAKKGSKIIDAVPLKLDKYDNYEDMESWNVALDTYFTNLTKNKIEEKKEKKFNERVGKLKEVLKKQKESLEEYKNKKERYSNIAEELYKNYDTITEIISKIKKAKKAGYSIEKLREIIEREKQSGVYEAEMIEEIRSDSVMVEIDGEEIEFTFDESIEKAAEYYYEKAKDAKSKIPGAKKTIKETQQKIKQVKNKEEEIKDKIERKAPKKKEKKDKKWFEKFHWFHTSGEKLAIGGRDATQNDILLKKYLEPRDLVFHTETAGSPFFILKRGKDAEREELKEVGTAAVSYSRAWKEGITSLDVFYVGPEQVSKQAPSGEYVSKGAWMIRGKKKFFKSVRLELAIGVNRKGKIICGPLSAIAKKASKYMIIKPGWNKKSKIADKFIDKFNLSTKKKDEIIRRLPAGETTITKVIS